MLKETTIPSELMAWLIRPVCKSFAPRNSEQGLRSELYTIVNWMRIVIVVLRRLQVTHTWDIRKGNQYLNLIQTAGIACRMATGTDFSALNRFKWK